MSSFGWKDIAGVWQNIQEVDLRPIRASAERTVRIMIISGDQKNADILAEAMMSDPARKTDTSLVVLPSINIVLPEETGEIAADLLVYLLSPEEDWPVVQDRVRLWLEDNQRVLMVVYSDDTSIRYMDTASGNSVKVIAGSIQDLEFLSGPFTGAVLDLLPDLHLALGRSFPLFRVSAARRLVRDVCSANSIYAFSTGLAEMVPVLNLPFNVADIIVLTKAQALLAYKLGLLLGMPVDWQYYIGELGGVIGGGFLWRQVARSLVGLIPIWGIVPKVAVAYAGTYAVGEAVLQWYLTGRKLSAAGLRGVYRRALDDGRKLARRLVSNRKRKNKLALKSGEYKLCPECRTANVSEANFCQHCGEMLQKELPPKSN